MPENFIYIVSHRLKMVSIAIVLISSIGVLHFFFGQSPTQEFFGIPIGSFECLLLFLFFLALLLVFWVDDEMWKEERKQLATQEEFCKFSEQINEYRKSLKNCSHGVQGFRELRDKLIIYSATIYGRFKLPCPETPLHFSDREWERSKEDWRIFLDNIYLCSEARDLSLARELSKAPVDIFPQHN